MLKNKFKAKVLEVMQRKNSQGVSSVPHFESVYDCARKMYDENVGAMLVKREGKVCGIITERDITRRAILDKWDPEKTSVDNIMSSNLETVSENDTIDRCEQLMKKNHCRHLPVLDGQREISGTISERDVFHFLAELE